MITQQISPAKNCFAVTTSDTAKLKRLATKGIVPGADGNVSVLLQNMADNATPVVIAVKAGAHYPWIVKKITATNTTATGIVAFYD